MKEIVPVTLLVFAVMLNLAAGDTQWFTKKLPVQLTNAESKMIPADTLKGKITAVYFSASWCPPCRAFTPKLVEFYNQVKDKGNFELIFVSCDRDKNAMMDYMKKYNMPFLAAPHRDPVAQALMRDLGVRGIPTLAVFAPDGKLITKNGRSDVMKNGAKALENWESQCK